MQLPWAGLVQTKLAVGSADDPLDAEADRIADRIVRSGQVARFDADIGSADRSREDGLIVRKPTPAVTSPGSPPTSAPDDLLRHLGAGQPMDAGTRAFFELHFDRRLGDVRIHRGPAASAAASSVQARAFTFGSDIVFAAG